MPARRHHYIPQFYLRAFAKDRQHPKLFVVDTETRTPFCTAPSNVAVELDFHTIDTPGQPSDVVERKLAGLESDISPAIERIRTSRSLASEGDRALFLTFVALLLIKNPGIRDRISESIGKVEMFRFQMLASNPNAWNAEMERAKLEGSIAKDADTEELRGLVLKDAFKIGISVPGHLMLEFRLLPSIIELVGQRKWMLFSARGGQTGFITSDNPVALSWFNQGPAQPPPGLGLAETQLIFPISNELAAIGTFEYKESVVDADDDRVAKINGNTILSRNRQVYAQASDFQYQMKHHDRQMLGSELLTDRSLA